MASLALQRSKQYLEEKGFHVWIVETWNSWTHTRRDLYSLGDLLAVRHDCVGSWMINACEDNGAVQAHVDKYLDGYDDKKKGRQPPNIHLPVWLSGGNRFSIFGWGKRSSSGTGSRKVWTLRIMDAYLDGAEVKFKELDTQDFN